MRTRHELNSSPTKQVLNSIKSKMSSFTGFSEADIRKVQNGRTPIMKTTNDEPQNKIMNLNKQKRSKYKADNKFHTKIKLIEPIPEEARLSLPESTTEEILNETPKVEASSEITSQTECEPEKRYTDLEEFETKHKLIEEQNRRRKELLAKALEDRTKRTLEEQQRLSEIQNEFKKLDANLSNDVKILRKQIELASVDYMEAQKKYNRAEKEYLDAKLWLHQKLERKEMLTEYLCAIIEKNEERKAEKLNELLEKLDLQSDQCVEVTTSEENKH